MKLQKVFAEFLGTALLLLAVVGSGIMATNLSQDVGVQLTINAISTVSMLYLIITLMGPISGAYFNPVVTLGELFKNRIDAKRAVAYIFAQFAGGFSGTVFANVIFNKPAIFQSQNERTGTNLFISEIFATAGLIMIIHVLTDQKRTNLAPLYYSSLDNNRVLRNLIICLCKSGSYLCPNLERYLCRANS